jgi:hypothetical protein
MKNQTNRIFLMFAVIGLASLIIGCPSNPPQNTQNTSNQNTADTNASNKTEPSQAVAPPCTGVDEATLKNEIGHLPPTLKNQFKEINPGSGTVSLSYSEQDHILIFKGYVYGNGAFQALVRGFDTFRTPQCVKRISFQGENDAANFAWCKDRNCPTPAPAANCRVDATVNTSRMKPQIPGNLTYTYNSVNGVLEFKGYAGDQPNKGQFTSLFAQLQAEMNIGCISKVVFAPGSGEAKKGLLRAGFDLQLCEYPLCESGTECVPCTRFDTNKSTNGNSNSNANVR